MNNRIQNTVFRMVSRRFLAISYCLVAISFFMPLSSHCQQNRADSLKTFLSYAHADTEKIKILNDIADYYEDIDSNKLRMEFLRKALKLAEANKLEATTAGLMKQIGVVYEFMNQYDSSVYYLKKAEAYYSGLPPSRRLLLTYYSLAEVYNESQQYSLATEYYTKNYELAERLKDSLAMNTAYNVFGQMYEQNGNFKLAVDYYTRALNVSMATKVYINVISDYVRIANVYAKQGLITNAYQAYLNALKTNTIYLKKDDASAVIYANLGSLYDAQNDTTKSLKYFHDALQIFEKQQNYQNVAIVLGNIGTACMHGGDYKDAEKYLLESLEQLQKYGDRSNLVECYSSLGEFYNKTKQYPKALEYYDMAHKMAEEANDVESQVYSLAGLSRLYAQTGNNAKAEELGEKALDLARKIPLFQQVRDISRDLSSLFQKAKQPDKALYYYKMYVDTKDSIENKEAAKKMIRAELNYEYEQKQAKEKAEQEKKDAINTEKALHERTIRNVYLVGFILVLFLTIMVFRNFLRVRKSNGIITEQKNEVELQKTIVEQKNRDITDSINYARRIQQAMLPTVEQWDNFFKESFIYYKPKDIVSGDFYWCLGSGNEMVFAVADCTGHGVPGAFMSMLGISSLNKIVGEQGIKQPDKVLNELRNEIITSLNPEGKLEEVNDGMDMTFCYLNREKGEMQYAAANNPLLRIRKNGQGYELKECYADKMPVGKFVEKDEKPFSLHKIDVKKGDRIYIFTDGYADQFGGEKGKKFKYRQLQELMLSIQDKQIRAQKDILEKAMNEWKGSLEQVDDILIIGIEV